MNSSVLTELSIWISAQTGAEITASSGTGEIVSMKAGDGKLYEIPDENDVRLRYQMSLTAEYTLEF